MNSALLINQSGDLIECVTFWINIYQSVSFFTGKVKTWTTENRFESKAYAERIALYCSQSDPGIKYIGAYRITLKPKN